MSYFENQQNSEINTIKKILTAQDADTVARRATNDPSIKVLDYSVNPYSSEVLGGLGSHWNLRITAKSSNKNCTDSLNFFVKSVPLNCQPYLSDFMKEEHVFEEETVFFEKIFPFLTENFKGEKWSPTCYLIKKDLLVMEDLRSQGYKLRDRFFDETDFLMSALKTVAHFHSCSILAEAKTGTPLNEKYPNSFREKHFSRNDFTRKWHTSSMEIASAVAKNLGRDPERPHKVFELVFDLVKPSTKHRNVISHNDLWPNNMMFDDLPRCVLVDFQTITYAPLAQDILKLLYLNTTREYRDKNERRLIEYYHSVLEETIGNNDTAGKARVPTLKEVIDAYDDLRLLGVIAPCLYFPVHLIDKEVVKDNPLKDSEKFEDFVVGSRVDVTLAAMEKDAWFKNKIEQAVIEFSEISEDPKYQTTPGSSDFSKDKIVCLEDVKVVAQRVTNDPDIKVNDYSLDAYSSEPMGYFGSHWQLKMSIKRKNTQSPETVKLFVKSLPIDNQGHTDFVRQSGVFEEESFFFNEMVLKLTENYVGQRWLPTCFLAKKDAIVLEDLGVLGFTQYKNIDEVDLMKSTLATVARFHSCSIVTEARLSRNVKHKIRLDEYYPSSFVEKSYSKSIKTWGYFNAGFKVSAAVAERLGYDPKKIYDTSAEICEMVKPSKKYRNIVCHGDLWANNLMYDESKNCLLIDFQFIRYTPQVLDILQLFYQNSPKSFREKYERELIEYYHSVLEETVRANDAEADCPSLEHVMSAYEDLRIFGVILASLHFPMSLLDPNITKEQTKDSEGYENFIFGDRTDVTLEYMSKNESYRIKVEEVVTELAEVAMKL